MANLWRDSVHGALYRNLPDDPADTQRATAMLVGLEPSRAIALVRVLAPLARARLAADVPCALDMARELRPELIILGAGAEGEVSAMLGALGADEQLEDIPVIVLATHDADEIRREAMRGGALAWLPQTVDAEALLARVRLAVRMRRNTRSRGSHITTAARG
ncbi:MAG: response regulator transcription factor [Burkholderiaceae bacterium]|nr:response regulator transcription factor [Burkholderiaceae bacterium]